MQRGKNKDTLRNCVIISISDEEIGLEGYDLFVRYRALRAVEGKGSGVLLYIKNVLRARQVKWRNHFPEQAWCKVKCIIFVICILDQRMECMYRLTHEKQCDNLSIMHYSTGRSLKRYSRDHSPSMNQPAVAPSVNLPVLFSAFAPDLVNTFTHRVWVRVSVSIIRIMMVKRRDRVRSVVRVRGYTVTLSLIAIPTRSSVLVR